ncbi:unnamed protein product [Phytophthora fragariaefolia]|uniref:Unnamed protein product n=1 Tax=Phytophthora fragariaefolia TaxID=1490495 RepID=A0A9W6XNS1_9STRA|nr:unnamed protein product [Phytophthora fragariaefolia]
MANHIVALAAHYRMLVKKDIQSFCIYYSLTSDIWTGRDGKNYISLTIHYLTDRFESRNWTLEVRVFPGIHDGPAIVMALNEMMETWLLINTYCTRLLRDGGSNMVISATRLELPGMSCVAHSLHLGVTGILISKKKWNKSIIPPAWETQVASENVKPILEHHEDEQLSNEERQDMAALRDLAVDKMDKFLNTSILSLEHDDLDSACKVVPQFRTLSTYFRKPPKG